MTGSPYVRENLAATRAGIPDPVAEVDRWLERLSDLLKTTLATREQAFDALALWAKLRRVRPELINQLGGAANLVKADAVLSERGTNLASHALSLQNPQAWLQEAADLEAAYEEAGLPEIRSGLAERLLTKLDDAQLALYAARRFGVEVPDLESKLDRCSDWMSEHVELFLAASVYVQAMGMTFRPNLLDFDYGLAATALKYVDVLRAAEEAEAESGLSHVRSFPSRVTRALADKYREQRDLAQALRAAFVTTVLVQLRGRMQTRPLARAQDDQALEPLLWWEWASPEYDRIARLTIPPQPLRDEMATVQFLLGDASAATDMEGRQVTLHGAEATIDAKAQARFRLEDLLQVNEPLVLRVGAPLTPWPLVAGSSLE